MSEDALRAEIIQNVIGPCYLDSAKRNPTEGLSPEAMVPLMKIMTVNDIEQMSASLLPVVDPSRSGIDAQGIVDRLLRCFGTGGLAHMQRRAVGASEGGGDALLSFEDAAQRRPTGILTA